VIRIGALQRVRRVALVVAVSLSLPGCGGGQRAPEARTLRLAFGNRLNSLDPIYLDGFTGAAIEALAFSFLLRPLPNGELVPDVAEAVPTLANGGIARDGRSITYRLRRGVLWQDGIPLTSADIAFTVRALQNPLNTIGSRDPYERIAAVETPDARTVRIRLRAPDAAVVGLFLTPDSNAAILPSHLLAHDKSLDHVSFNGLPIGSGPYRVVSWTRGSTLRLVANPTYYAGAPKLGALELRYTPDTATTVIQLQTGEIDGVVNADPLLVPRYRTLPSSQVTSVPYTGADVLAFNLERPALAGSEMRTALARAVDAPTLVREMYRGAISSADASRGMFSYADNPSAPWPKYDPIAAGRELDALGWKRGSSGIRAKNGHDLELTLAFSNASTSQSTGAVILQQQLARVGVRVELRSFLYTQFYALASDGGPLANGRFDLALIAYSTDSDPDQRWLLSCAERAPRGFNWSRYCSPEADRLLAASSLAFDRARRVAILQRLQRLIATDVPFLPLWQSREIDVMPKALDGFAPNGALPYASARDWSFARSCCAPPISWKRVPSKRKVERSASSGFVPGLGSSDQPLSSLAASL
jgi:peptide/nickel transport system substrate-binding protein